MKDGYIPIRGSFFTPKAFHEARAKTATQFKDNVAQGYKPTGHSGGVLSKFEGIPLAYWDIPTLNDMIFSRRLWENLKQSEQIQYLLKNNCFWGEAKHNDAEEVYLENVACRVSDFWIDSNNLVLGNLDILDTPPGLAAHTLATAGSIGNSSRGWGKLNMNSSGSRMVDEADYFHVCWDLVAFPAVPDCLFSVQQSLRNPALKQALQSSVDSLDPASKVLRDYLDQLKTLLEDQKKFFSEMVLPKDISVERPDFSKNSMSPKKSKPRLGCPVEEAVEQYPSVVKIGEGLLRKRRSRRVRR